MMPPEWKARIMGWIRAAALRWEVISASGDGGAYQLDGRDEEGRTWQLPAQLYHHGYGVRGKAGARAEALTAFLLGSSAQRVILATRSRPDEPAELAEWEVDLYSRFKQRVHLREDGGLHITTDKGHAAELRADGSIVVTAADGRIFATSKGGAEVELDASDVTTAITHITGRGDTPTVIAGTAALGAAGTATISGTDNGFSLSLTTDTMTAPGAGVVATVTFAEPWKAAPNGASVTPIGADAADLQVYIDSLSDTEIKIGVAKANLDTNHIYNLSVTVIGG